MKPIMIAGIIAAAILIVPSVAEAQYGHTRRVRRRTAVVVGTTVHAADQAAAQQQAAKAPTTQAQPAAQPAPAAGAPAPPPVAPGQPLPIGAVVAALPTGCASTTVSGVEYYRCGSDWYRAMFQGDQLVYVTTPVPQ